MVHISLAPTLVLMVFYVSTFRRLCAVPNIAVFCSSFPVCCPPYSPNGASRSNYYRYHRCFHIPHTFNFYCNVFIFYIFFGFFFDYFPICWDGNIYQLLIIIITLFVAQNDIRHALIFRIVLPAHDSNLTALLWCFKDTMKKQRFRAGADCKSERGWGTHWPGAATKYLGLTNTTQMVPCSILPEAGNMRRFPSLYIKCLCLGNSRAAVLSRWYKW